jgi:hypothetical protein
MLNSKWFSVVMEVSFGPGFGHKSYGVLTIRVFAENNLDAVAEATKQVSVAMTITKVLSAESDTP